MDEARQIAGAGSIGDDRSASALDGASRSFRRARGAIEHPILAPVRVLPVIGRQLRATAAQIRAVADITALAHDVTQNAGEALDADARGGPARLELLRRLDLLVTRTAHELQRIDIGPSEALIGPVASQRELLERRIREAEEALRNAHATLAAATDVLANDRSYLVLAANNAEMRSGSGMFLSVGLLRASGGSIVVDDMRPSGDLLLDAGKVPLEGDLAARWGWLEPNRDFRNLGVSPRFDVTGPLAKAMWEARGGAPVDGVIALDVVALRAVLTATGPVDTGTRVVSAADVVELLTHDQYAELGAELGAAQLARRDELGRIATASVAALDHGADLETLMTEVVAAAAGRHLLAWSEDPAVQAGWDAAGISGRLDANDLLVGVINRGANKLDHFLEVTAELRHDRAPDGTTVSIDVELTNHTPPGEPPYVSGPYPGLDVDEAEYVGLLSISVPAGASSPQLSDGRRFAAAGPDGAGGVVATEVRIAQGERQRIVLTFHLPGAHGRVDLLPSARVPPVPWEADGRKFTDAARQTLRW